MPRNCLSWISLAKGSSTAGNMLLTLPLSTYNYWQKPSLWLLLVLFVGQLFLCQSRCPNLCSGHGFCNSTDSCTCYEGWDGARDCSRRDCKRGVALFSAGGHTTDNSMAECSNAGTCDRLTGFCTCHTGYVGVACEKLTCPPYPEEGEESVDNICNGHGYCQSVYQAGLNHGIDSSDGSIGDGLGPAYTGWDKNFIHGCICDWGWGGYDCTHQLCPKGDDPLTTGTNLVFTITTDVGSGSLGGLWVLKFVGHEVTFEADGTILSNSSCTAAISSLPNVETATCVVSNVDSTKKAATMTITISSFPILPFENNIHTHSGSPALSQITCKGNLITSTHTSPSCTVAITTAATKEYMPCSNRGICDFATGECQCFTNYYGSACQTRGVTQEIDDAGAALQIASTGDSYTGNVLELTTTRSASSDFNFLKATASGSTIFTIQGDGAVKLTNGLQIDKGGATISEGGLSIEDGIIEVYDDDNNALIKAGAVSAGYTGNILELTANIDASTDYNFIKFSNDFVSTGGTQQFRVDGLGQVFITSTAQSTSTTTGSFQTTGGAGVAKTLYVGQGVVSLDTTLATSSTTGSVIVAGGLGVAGNFYTGGGLVVEDGGAYFANSATGDVDVITLTQTDTEGFTGSILRLEATQAAGTTYNLVEAYSSISGSPVEVFSIRGDGRVKTSGALSITSGGVAITAGGLSATGTLTFAGGGITMSSTSAQAITHTGASGADLTVSSTNGDVNIESIKFSGSVLSGHRYEVESLAGAKTLQSSQSGTRYFLNNQTGFTVTLPACTANTLGTFFEFDVLVDSTSGYKILKSGSDTITGGVHTVGTTSSFSTAAVSGANQVNLQGHGTCVEPFAIRTCKSTATSTFNNDTTCLEDPCANGQSDCQAGDRKFVETYGTSCTASASHFCFELNTKAKCTTQGVVNSEGPQDDDRTTPQVWTNGPGGDMGTRIMLTCVADTLWYLSGVVISDETVSSTEGAALTSAA